MDYAFAYAEKNEMVTEANYPYKGKDGICEKKTSTHEKLRAYKDVRKDSVP